MNTFHNLKVADKKLLTPESFSVVLDVPESLRKKFHFKPGQFVIVQKDIKGQKLKRYYSIYNSSDEGVIKLGIKRKGKDGFADYVMHDLQVGDFLQVSEPMDDVPFDLSDRPQKILAITIGSGITPFYSYIRYMLNKQPQNKLVLIYGNESPDKTMFYKELQNLETEHPDQLKLYYVYSKNHSGQYHGRINAGILKDILHKEGTDFDAVYMIGPDDLKKMAASVLTDTGIEPDKLYYRVYS